MTCPSSSTADRDAAGASRGAPGRASPHGPGSPFGGHPRSVPIGFFGFLLSTSRREMLDAIATPIGRTALGVGLGLELVAFAWIRHLLQVR